MNSKVRIEVLRTLFMKAHNCVTAEFAAEAWSIVVT